MRRCVAAIMLAGGLLLPVQLRADSSSPSQDESERKSVTISGTAISPDGAAAASLPVEVIVSPHCALGMNLDGGDRKEGPPPPPPELLAQGPREQRTLGKGVTDAQGRFSIKVDYRKEVPLLEVRIGDKLKSAWTVKPLRNKDEDTDLGNLQLHEKISLKP
jgi:hypothetical protein